MRAYCSMVAALVLSASALKAPDAEAAEIGKCNYFFGLCTSCELPLTCSNSERLDPTQNFGTQQARSTQPSPRPERAATQQASPRPPYARQRTRPDPSEFEEFKTFLRQQGYRYTGPASSEQRALYDSFVRWKGRGSLSVN